MSFPKVIIKYEIPRAPPAPPPSGNGGGGGTGPPGPPGPNAVSGDANNKAILGSDSLILVQGTKSGAAATTHGQTVSGDDPQLRDARLPLAHRTSHEHGGSDPVTIRYSDLSGTPASFPPSAHASTHESGGLDAIPLDRLALPSDSTLLDASTSMHGLLRKLDGNTAHYLDGTGNWTAPAATGAGSGDMTKAVYDTNNDGIVDKAAILSTPGAAHQFWKNGNSWAAVDWSDLTSIPVSFSPGSHAASHAHGGSDPVTITYSDLAGIPAFFNPSAHAVTHRIGGSDALPLDSLAAPSDITALNVSITAHGLTPKAPNDTTKVLRGDGLFGTLLYSALGSIPSAFPPFAHATTHEAGGSDAIALDSLAAPSDITSLNASATAHGLLRKLDNNSAHYLDGTGNWTPPTVTGGTPGINAFTFTAANFTCPPIGATVTVTVADASWMVLGQTLWIETAGGGAGIAGEMQVTAISGTSVTLLNVSVGAGGAPIWGETPGGNINGINLNYTTANPYTSGHLAVYLNGLRLRRTNDYIETGSQTFQILAAPLAGDSLSVDYM